MASPTLPIVFSSFFGAAFFLLFACSPVAGLAPSPISDDEISVNKGKCYADIQSGLWGERCRSSTTDIENCALRCLSPVCYELIYEGDPLEEGERDDIRSKEYRYCMRRSSVGLSLDEVKGTFNHFDLHVRPPSMSFPGSVRISAGRGS